MDRSHDKVLVQIFMLYNVQLGRGNCEVIYSYSKQKETINAKLKKTKIYQ